MGQGVDGVWNDMNEPAVFRVPSKTMPLDNWHRGGEGLPAGPHAEYHNVYGMLMVKATREGVKRGGKRFGEAVWGPTARAGKVLWLEVTGVFFALVAAGGAQSVWIHRVGISSTASTYERQHFWLSIGMFCLFAYFCVSSFVRANRKSRG